MNILELVENCRRIGISGHENPDGDCAGSCCGIALYLRKMLPQARVDIYLEPLRDCLAANIPGADTIIHEMTGDEDTYDAFIVLDSTPERIGKPEKLYREAAVKINVDHHMTNRGSSDAHCYIDGHSSSACELVYDLIGKDDLDAEIAQALYVGIVTDTGVFRYSNTAESTMRAAGHLMSFGFDHSRIIREVFFERTYLQAKILGAALTRSDLFMNGKCIFSCFDGKTMEELSAERKDLDGISEQLLLTEGVDCSVFFHETEPGIWRASMRSVLVTDVAKTASLFGGGGHVHAAGCTISTDISAAMKAIADDIEGQLRKAGAL